MAVAALLASLAPVVVGAVAVRPASAAVGYDQYGLTALASGIRTAGDVGASGGLVTLDSGSGYVAARLDASPSSGALAEPYEPGTLARTGAGQVNAQAGSEVIVVPEARAAYPGDGKASLTTVPPQSSGPLTSGGGSATAAADATSAKGTATGAALTVTGALESEGSTSSVEMKVDAAAGVVTSTATTRISRVLVGGVLELRDVVAKASITTADDKHTSVATLTVGGASVAGQEVALDQDGVHAVGTPLIPGKTISDATDQANAVLQNAGIEVHANNAIHTATTRAAEADTGGVVISLATPDLPGGVAANSLTVVVGGVSLTETDEPTAPALALPVTAPAVAPPAAGAPPVTTTTVIPGTPAVPGAVTAPAPAVAAPAAAPASFLVGGRRLSASVALAAFAIWQFLSLGTATLYALVDRRRRMALA
jgi:pilus assembly protein FimV